MKELLKQNREYVRGERIKPMDDDSSPIEDWIDDNMEEAGDLHKIHWRRVSSLFPWQR